MILFIKKKKCFDELKSIYVINKLLLTLIFMWDYFSVSKQVL